LQSKSVKTKHGDEPLEAEEIDEDELLLELDDEELALDEEPLDELLLEVEDELELLLLLELDEEELELEEELEEDDELELLTEREDELELDRLLLELEELDEELREELGEREDEDEDDESMGPPLLELEDEAYGEEDEPIELLDELEPPLELLPNNVRGESAVRRTGAFTDFVRVVVARVPEAFFRIVLFVGAISQLPVSLRHFIPPPPCPVANRKYQGEPDSATA